MSIYSDQDQFHAGPGHLDKFPADAWSTGAAKQNIMELRTKKVVFGTLGSIAALWLAMMCWIGTGYFMDLRYEQQVKRLQLEQIEQARAESDRKHKEWLAGAKVREEQAKIDADRQKVEAVERHRERVREFQRDAEERAQKVEQNRLVQEEARRHRAAKAAAYHEESMTKMLAQESARRADLRKKAGLESNPTK